MWSSRTGRSARQASPIVRFRGRSSPAPRMWRRACRPASSRARSVELLRTEHFTFPFGTHICAVDVDRDTGHGRDQEVHRGGRLRTQIIRCSSRVRCRAASRNSIGQVLFEQDRVRRERAAAHRRVHGLCDTARIGHPRVRPRSHREPSPVNPLGVKGVGEAGTIGATTGDRQCGARRAPSRSASRIWICDDARACVAGDQDANRSDGVGPFRRWCPARAGPCRRWRPA